MIVEVGIASVSNLALQVGLLYVDKSIISEVPESKHSVNKRKGLYMWFVSRLRNPDSMDTTHRSIQENPAIDEALEEILVRTTAWRSLSTIGSLAGAFGLTLAGNVLREKYGIEHLSEMALITGSVTS